MINLQNVTARRGTKILFTNATFTINPGDKIGITGPNGSGKSSLFGVLCQELDIDAGDLSIPPPSAIGVMRQEIKQLDRTALAYVVDGDAKLRQLESDLAAAEDSNLQQAMVDAHAALDSYRAFEVPVRAQQIMAGLGFKTTDLDKRVSDFSGGWRIRLNLARTLLQPADIMLLDEPTNHLDIDTIEWLERWLMRYEGILLLISHDRDFLDTVTNGTYQIEHEKIQCYKGNYSAAEKQRAAKLAQQQSLYEKQQTRIKEIDSFVRRFKAKATKAKQAQSRLKELGRLEIIEAARVESPFTFTLPAAEKTSDPLINLNSTTLGYGKQAILNRVDLSIRPGDRIGVLGANGQGKSTLLKSLAGLMPLVDGERITGEHLYIGYFSQHQLETLDDEASPLLHLQRLSPNATEQEIRNYLGSFAFNGDQAVEPITHFSGGEKARLALAVIAWQKPNVLILDEPTNHLDIGMRDALTLAMQTFEGAVVLVSHDRHLLRSCADELWLVRQGRCEDFDGSLGDYQKLIQQDNRGPEKTNESTDNKKLKRQAAATMRQQLAPLRKAASQAEKHMEKLQQEFDILQDQLSDNSYYEAENAKALAELLKQQGVIKKQLEDTEEQWLEASEALEDAQSE